MSLEQSHNTASADRETYLAEVTKGLHNRLSPIETYHQIDEIRQHLKALASAYEEMGWAPADAMRDALLKFGNASEIAKGILEAMNLPSSPQVFGETYGPRRAVTSMRAFLRLILMGTIIGTGLAKFVDQLISTAPQPTAWPTLFAIGAYASCFVAGICWSFTKLRPSMIGLLVAGSSTVLTAAVFLPAKLTFGYWPITPSVLGAIAAAMYLLGVCQARVSKRLRARIEVDSPANLAK